MWPVRTTDSSSSAKMPYARSSSTVPPLRKGDIGDKHMRTCWVFVLGVGHLTRRMPRNNCTCSFWDPYLHARYTPKTPQVKPHETFQWPRHGTNMVVKHNEIPTISGTVAHIVKKHRLGLISYPQRDILINVISLSQGSHHAQRIDATAFLSLAGCKL